MLTTFQNQNSPGTLYQFHAELVCSRIGGTEQFDYKLVTWLDPGSRAPSCRCLRRESDEKDEFGNQTFYDEKGGLMRGELVERCCYTGKESNAQGICLYEVTFTDGVDYESYAVRCGACQFVTKNNERPYR